jgi:ribosomal protein L16 Arg81 hydroxylase
MTKTELDRMTNKEVQLQQEIDQMKATILETIKTYIQFQEEFQKKMTS